MTRVGWLADEASTIGGAELTQAEFRAAAPSGVEIVDCPPSGVVPGLDLYVVQNCVNYSVEDLAESGQARVVKYWHDVGMHVQPGVREWLDSHAQLVYCSPLQHQYMARFGAAGHGGARPGQARQGAVYIPPPIELARFEEAASKVNGNRSGQVCVGSWRNYGKAPQKVAEWALENGPVDFFGDGVFAPAGSQAVPYDAMPALLAQYKRFVFLPLVLEPFGRLVVEAWAAGLEIVTNRQVGATYWITEKPEAIESAAEDFWRLVLDA